MSSTAPFLLSPAHAARFDALPRRQVPVGTVLFRPGDPAEGFVVVLEGRIEVFLTGVSGREILLYAVEPGQSCIQTTLGLIGDEAYSGEAVTATPASIVMVPKALFLTLMDSDPGFRSTVLSAFGRRMQEITRLLEQVAFGRIEARLAATLLDLAHDGEVHATQADLAARIGSAREVVTRRLDAMGREGIVQTERGVVHLCDLGRLRQLAAGTG